MKKLLASFLAVVMILGALSVCSFAGTTPAAPSPSSLQYWINLATAQNNYTVTVPYSVTVDASTIIPSGCTINTAAGTLLTVSSDLKIEGILNINGYLYVAKANSLSGSGKVIYNYIDQTIVPSAITSLVPVTTVPTTMPSWWITPSNVSQYYSSSNVPFYYYNGNYYYYYNGQYYLYNSTTLPANYNASTNYYNYLNSYYWNYYYYPQYYYDNYRCAAPTASVASGYVDPGTAVTLSTTTAGAAILYTIDGSTPNAGSYRYAGPISVTRDMTIKAIAVYGAYITSAVSTFDYNVTVKAKYGDLKGYDGLSQSLAILSKFGAFSASSTFDPKGTFTYAELMAALKAVGFDISKVTIDGADDLAAQTALTYNDFVYVTYKVLRANDVIESPQKNGSEEIKQLASYRNIKNAAIYKAAFVSFIENGLFYDLAFDPTASAPRYQLATVLAAAYLLK